MKFMYFNDYRLGVVKGNGVVDITDIAKVVPHRDTLDLMAGVIEQFGSLRGTIEAEVAKASAIPLSEVAIRVPLPRVRQIDCMATNYMEDGTLEKPFEINAFHKSPHSLIAQDEVMVLDDIPASCFEAEAELAVVIGKRASYVSEDEALDYVFGYMNFIDGSARAATKLGNSFFQVKSRHSFAPVGPYIVTADEISDAQAMQVRLWVNGELRQNFNTSDMAYSIARSISWLSSIHALEPGDIVATGTNHRGLSALHDGDVVELECEGCGRLRFNVRDDLKRTWEPGTRIEQTQRRAAQGIEPKPTGLPARQLTGKYAPQ